MNFKQLEAFQAIMASGSATGAAERLGLSQSAISRLLAQFEEDLGLRLFVREKGRLVPTREAEALLQDAQGLVDSAQCLRRHSEQLRLGGFKRRLLKVAVPSTLATALMPSIAQRFMREHPDAVLEILSGSYSDTERALLSRDADVGLVRLPMEMPGLHASACLESDAVCIMPLGHPLEHLPSISPLDLLDTTLILLGRQRLIRHEIDMAFRQARVQPRVAIEVHSVSVACSHVAQGLGVSIVNALLASYCRPMGFSSRPFKPRISYQLGVATLGSSAQAPLNAAFSQLLLDAILAAVRPEDHTRIISAPAA
ncbi:LysR substrate-binding domain-containing protein [Variovorax terrae]|uniref:LysR substrate-binding domain-containing protein n=1 Tax=Variovorax terrae TaxID=2923278 RepID=A0A9X1W0R8_9BURK|nr:LysR substrate-binding domain-containing protein [Variovorax terrae]MCJ0763988.1 LysR substrate-binding domain-containing protein [Variovorax terrae]